MEKNDLLRTELTINAKEIGKTRYAKNKEKFLNRAIVPIKTVKRVTYCIITIIEY